MADVRGATGVPGTAAFGGTTTPTPSTPLYVDLATGDLYVLINNVVTLVGAIPGGSSFILAEQVFGKHYEQQSNVADANTLLAMRSFTQSQTATNSAVIGEASDIIGQRSMAPHPQPTMWS